jgi:hypothetical protein
MTARPKRVRAPGSPLSMDEAAAALNVSRRFLQEFIKQIPPCHLQAGRRKLFDEASIAVMRRIL